MHFRCGWQSLLQRWLSNSTPERDGLHFLDSPAILILFFCCFVLLFLFCHFRTAHYKCKSSSPSSPHVLPIYPQVYKLVEHMLWILFCIILALPNSFEWYTRVSLTDLKNFLSTTLFPHALDFILYNTGTAHLIWMVHQSFTNRPNQNFLVLQLSTLFESRFTLEGKRPTSHTIHIACVIPLRKTCASIN